ncbi:MAG: bifunctional riboflavin kinase/FAD synthetase [Betaproteobacteria bacterium]|nr:bifunctional riboflavin kinase/FAD synthetase [Betaproteobacteria bacterium]
MQVTHGMLPAPAGRLTAPARRHAITIGNFDGVHRGHQAMLARLRAKAKALGVPACVLTFEPHPREFFAPQSAQTRLTRLTSKLTVLRNAGVDRVHVARFEARFAALAPEQFIEQVLVQGLGCAWLIVGEDFRFGARRAGDFAMLERAGRTHGFGVEAMPEVRVDGVRVSSSGVRAALEAGDLAAAEVLLGRTYVIAGRVAHGEKLGRTLGSLTANIVLPHKPPLAGIFVVEVDGVPSAAGASLPAVASLGVRPTVNEVPVPLLEVHLLDFDGDLYGSRLKVRFLSRLRDEEKYSGLDELRAAIAGDVANARKFFAMKTNG